MIEPCTLSRPGLVFVLSGVSEICWGNAKLSCQRLAAFVDVDMDYRDGYRWSHLTKLWCGALISGVKLANWKQTLQQCHRNPCISPRYSKECSAPHSIAIAGPCQSAQESLSWRLAACICRLQLLHLHEPPSVFADLCRNTLVHRCFILDVIATCH